MRLWQYSHFNLVNPDFVSERRSHEVRWDEDVGFFGTVVVFIVIITNKPTRLPCIQKKQCHARCHRGDDSRLGSRALTTWILFFQFFLNMRACSTPLDIFDVMNLYHITIWLHYTVFVSVIRSLTNYAHSEFHTVTHATFTFIKCVTRKNSPVKNARNLTFTVNPQGSQSRIDLSHIKFGSLFISKKKHTTWNRESRYCSHSGRRWTIGLNRAIGNGRSTIEAHYSELHSSGQES